MRRQSGERIGAVGVVHDVPHDVQRLAQKLRRKVRRQCRERARPIVGKRNRKGEFQRALQCLRIAAEHSHRAELRRQRDQCARARVLAAHRRHRVQRAAQRLRLQRRGKIRDHASQQQRPRLRRFQSLRNAQQPLVELHRQVRGQLTERLSLCGCARDALHRRFKGRNHRLRLQRGHQIRDQRAQRTHPRRRIAHRLHAREQPLLHGRHVCRAGSFQVRR